MGIRRTVQVLCTYRNEAANVNNTVSPAANWYLSKNNRQQTTKFIAYLYTNDLLDETVMHDHCIKYLFQSISNDRTNETAYSIGHLFKICGWKLEERAKVDEKNNTKR